MGASERLKGQRFEQKIVRWFTALGIRAERNLTETREGKTGDVHAKLKSFSLIVEAKFKKDPSEWAALREAEEAVRTLGKNGFDLYPVPVAIVRTIGKKTEVVIRIHDLALLLAEQNEVQNVRFEYRVKRGKKERACVLSLDDLSRLLVGRTAPFK